MRSARKGCRQRVHVHAHVPPSVHASFRLFLGRGTRSEGVGLVSHARVAGVSVIIDVTVVRLVIVPSAMFLFGRANWWTSRWLDKVLPHVEL